MKTILLLTFLAVLSAYSQGTVNFNNFVSSGNRGAASYEGTGPVSAGPINGANSVAYGGFYYGGIYARAGLYYGAPGTTPCAMTMLGTAVSFRSGSSAGYVNVGSGSTRTVPGIPEDSPADFVIKIWDTGANDAATFEDAAALSATRSVYLGQSLVYHVTALGGSSNPADIPGQQAFSFCPLCEFPICPEPSIIGLSFLGMVTALVFIRRRN